MVWPEKLINEIARRRCVLFIGSGVSSMASWPSGGASPSWREFLGRAALLVSNENLRNEIGDLISRGSLLLALQAIRDNSDITSYEELLLSCFNAGGVKSGKIHELILRLDSRIVITTNFDKIYENHCEQSDNSFMVKTYSDDSLGDAIRSDTRVIIKAHGTINDIRRMIFTRSQYHEAKKKHSGFYSILQALFLTNTCVFVGCGMDDPDINLLLEDVKIASSSMHPHYALVKKGEHSRIKVDDWLSSYNIKALEYGSSYDDLVPLMEELCERVDYLRANHPEP